MGMGCSRSMSKNNSVAPAPAPVPSPSGASTDNGEGCDNNDAPCGKRGKAPKLGPKPTLLSRRQVDALYTLLEAVTNGLNQLSIPYILTGGSLLGAVRQHSILFCDDDVDLAILESNEGDDDHYERAKARLPSLLGNNYRYTVRPWEGGDRVRLKNCSNVFLDVFVIRKYATVRDLLDVIGVKRNGERQTHDYVRGIVEAVAGALHGELTSAATKEGDEGSFARLVCPIWHFSTRKAIELWPKEVYRHDELFPTICTLKMGPVVELSGPNTPVRLLKRAFGEDCFEVYYQSVSHGRAKRPGKNKDREGLKDDGSEADDKGTQKSSTLPPLVSSGGQWTQNEKIVLDDEHYLPMQPVSRARRRDTLHCKSSLFEYLRSQTEKEVLRLRESASLPAGESEIGKVIPQPERSGRTVYMDGVFDLFHVGHLNAIHQCSALGDRVIIGVTGDDDASGYKRRPIVPESERTAILKALEVVDDVVCPCPLVVTRDFMEQWGIDLVVHGFASQEDKDRQREFFQVAIDDGKFREIEYYSRLSTTDILSRIRADDRGEEGAGNFGRDKSSSTSYKKNGVNPKWFGAALANATNNSACIPYDPFPLELRIVIEQQLRKATKKRQDALNAIKEVSGALAYDNTLASFESNYAKEGTFKFDSSKHDLRKMFLRSCDLPTNFDLSRLHQLTTHSKDDVMFALTQESQCFQRVYDEFVRSVCCPLVASLSDGPMGDVYYQSFPCVRVVRPGDFSIGPHADVAYGHHPCSVNFYVPLTPIGGSASLFLESRPGAEDWHPFEGAYGMAWHFTGALCAHWTPENRTDLTRVSLDFRIIPGPMFHMLQCGGKRPGGVRDVYREREGYYNRCCLIEKGQTSVWDREGPLHTPDARFGFPWTAVKKKSRRPG